MLAVYDPATQQVMLVPSSSVIGEVAVPGEGRLQRAPMQVLTNRDPKQQQRSDAHAIPCSTPDAHEYVLYSRGTTATEQWAQEAAPTNLPYTAVSALHQHPWGGSGMIQSTPIGPSHPAYCADASANAAARNTSFPSRAGKRSHETSDSDTEDDNYLKRTGSGGRGAPNDPRERNRQAQRRFRARQKELIAELQTKLEGMKKQAIRHEQEISSLREENTSLKRQFQPPAVTSPRCNGGGASADSSPQLRGANRTVAVPMHLHTPTSKLAVLPVPAPEHQGQYGALVRHFMRQDSSNVFVSSAQGAAAGFTA